MQKHREHERERLHGAQCAAVPHKIFSISIYLPHTHEAGSRTRALSLRVATSLGSRVQLAPQNQQWISDFSESPWVRRNESDEARAAQKCRNYRRGKRA